MVWVALTFAVLEASDSAGDLGIVVASYTVPLALFQLFGGALAGSPREYLQFFLPGILVQTVIFNSSYSGVGLCTDLQKGLFDRFRSLPIWSLAPFAGLMVGDLLRHLIAGSIILAIGLLLGLFAVGALEMMLWLSVLK